MDKPPQIIPSPPRHKTTAPHLTLDKVPQNRPSEPPPLPKIAVIGGASVDLYLIGCEEWPKVGERLDLDSVEYHPGGNGLNVAVALAKLEGVDVELYTAVGSGGHSEFLRRAATQANPTDLVHQRRNLKRPVNLRLATVPEGTTATLSIVKLSGTDPSFIRAPGATEHLHVAHLRDHFGSLSGASFVFLAGLGLTRGLDAVELRQLLCDLRIKKPNLKIIADVALLAQQSLARQDLVFDITAILPYIDFFIPNEHEAIQYSGCANEEAAARRFLDRGVREAVVVKRANAGVNLYRREGNVTLPEVTAAYTPDITKGMSVLDTTGAGDTWGAGFVASLARNKDIQYACKIGNAVAAFCIQKRGATTNIIHNFGFFEGWIAVNPNDRVQLQ